MKLGVVGLPNVGKSTLFNAITKAGAEAANYPFCTIEPNVGIVTVPDERVTKLHEIYNSKRTIYATIEFCDIAGLERVLQREKAWATNFSVTSGRSRLSFMLCAALQTITSYM